jgi:hypothetical protein
VAKVLTTLWHSAKLLSRLADLAHPLNLAKPVRFCVALVLAL